MKITSLFRLVVGIEGAIILGLGALIFFFYFFKIPKEKRFIGSTFVGYHAGITCMVLALDRSVFLQAYPYRDPWWMFTFIGFTCILIFKIRIFRYMVKKREAEHLMDIILKNNKKEDHDKR